VVKEVVAVAVPQVVVMISESVVVVIAAVVEVMRGAHEPSGCPWNVCFGIAKTEDQTIIIMKRQID
jgi:hypothetical protein